MESEQQMTNICGTRVKQKTLFYSKIVVYSFVTLSAAVYIAITRSKFQKEQRQDQNQLVDLLYPSPYDVGFDTQMTTTEGEFGDVHKINWKFPVAALVLWLVVLYAKKVRGGPTELGRRGSIDHDYYNIDYPLISHTPGLQQISLQQYKTNCSATTKLELNKLLQTKEYSDYLRQKQIQNQVNSQTQYNVQDISEQLEKRKNEDDAYRKLFTNRERNLVEEGLDRDEAQDVSSDNNSIDSDMSVVSLQIEKQLSSGTTQYSGKMSMIKESVIKHLLKSPIKQSKTAKKEDTIRCGHGLLDLD